VTDEWRKETPELLFMGAKRRVALEDQDDQQDDDQDGDDRANADVHLTPFP
jgi:hypothetical protein